MRKSGKMCGLFNGNCRLNRYAAVFIAAFILIASLPFRVSGSQEIYIEAGDTMVLPCLAELWSDQSFSCAVGNPDVLMTDGSGRAVIALRAGRSDVYVHITNPDTDVLYTFVVTEPAAASYAYPDVWDNWEAEQSPGDTSQDREQESDTSQGREQEGDGAHSGRSSRSEDAGPETSGDGADAGGNTSAEDPDHGSGHGTGGQSEPVSRGNADNAGSAAAGNSSLPGETENAAEEAAGGGNAEDGRKDAAGESGSTGETENAAKEAAGGGFDEDDGADEPGMSYVQGPEAAGEDNDEVCDIKEEKRPYWENPAQGGIRFVPVRASGAGAEADGDSIPKIGEKGRADMYRECVRIVSDGEVRPVFVCVNGRDISFKYMDKTIYVRESDLTGGTVRGGVLDCRGKMYFFSC